MAAGVVGDLIRAVQTSMCVCFCVHVCFCFTCICVFECMCACVLCACVCVDLLRLGLVCRLMRDRALAAEMTRQVQVPVCAQVLV